MHIFCILDTISTVGSAHVHKKEKTLRTHEELNMNKLIILLILLVAILYASTERYIDVQRNLAQEGWIALVEEPFWIGGWVSEKLSIAYEDISAAIDGKTLGRKL